MRPRILAAIQATSALFLALSFTAGLAALPAPASAQEAPFTLAGNPDVHADRLSMLREEFKERQHEVREQLERYRTHKTAHGRKAVPAAPGIDQLPANLAAGHFALPSGISSAQLVPANVMANNKTGDATGASAAGQAEQSLAFLGLNGLAAWNDGQGFNLSPQDVQGYGYTTDGGATWTDGGIPLKGGTMATWSSDPSVAVNEKTGSFYYNGLTTNTGTNNNGVGVARGHFSGASFIWDAATMVASGPSSTQGFDKQWIAADSSNGNLYVTWTLFTTTGSNIWFARSTDNGATWSAPLQINGTWENGLVSGSRPMVGPNGEVYVQYTAIGPVDADSVKIARSTNAGASFAPAVVALTEYDNYFNGAPGFSRPRAVTFASGAVDRSTGPNRGRVYLAIQDCVDFYADAIGGGGSKSEVENNGGFANATPFTIGQTLRGSLATTADQDWWKFPATQGTTYIFFVDSLRTTSLRYTMRLYCPNDTTVLSRLGFSGAQATNSALGSHSLIVWTAPTTNTYYLRMVPVTVGSGVNNYRIQSGVHVPSVLDVARDERDAVVATSADGVTGWSVRRRVNDDSPYYDNWLPEVAVPSDGNAYTMWFDWRDTPATCFGGSNIYLSRSTNGGTTWSANQVATTATTANWTQVVSNITPNQGDYNGLYGGDCLALAWADGRLGDSDVWTTRLATTYSLSGCPGDQDVTAGLLFSTSVNVNNLNSLFANTYNYTVSVNAAWPGYPITGTVTVGAGGTNSVPIDITAPITVPSGTIVQVCATVSLNGAQVQSCCFNATVHQHSTAALASLASSTAGPGRVTLSWIVSTTGAVNVYRTADGTSWDAIGSQVPDNQGMVNVVDTDVVDGGHYGYRLGLQQGGVEVYAGQAWVDVPLSAEFAIGHAFPSPAKSGFSVSFSLPNNAPATLDVIDLAGRRVYTRAVGSMGAGRHTLSLEKETGRLPIGVYAVRLSQAGHVATIKATIIR